MVCCSYNRKCSFYSSQVLLPYVKATCDDFYEELRTKADVGLPHMSVSVMVVCVCLICVSLMYVSVTVMYVSVLFISAKTYLLLKELYKKIHLFHLYYTKSMTHGDVVVHSILLLSKFVTFMFTRLYIYFFQLIYTS